MLIPSFNLVLLFHALMLLIGQPACEQFPAAVDRSTVQFWGSWPKLERLDKTCPVNVDNCVCCIILAFWTRKAGPKKPL